MQSSGSHVNHLKLLCNEIKKALPKEEAVEHRTYKLIIPAAVESQITRMAAPNYSAETICVQKSTSITHKDVRIIVRTILFYGIIRLK